MGALDKLLEGMPDPDDMFAYDTVKEVKVLDRRLGLVFYTVLLLILFYIVIFVFMIKKAYQDIEKTNGWILSKVLNPVHDQNFIPWDAFDAVTNPGEQGAIFLPTRVVITRGQKEDGFCESELYPCKDDDDCDIGNPDIQKTECSNNMCKRRQWCPTAKDLKEDNAESTVHYIDARLYHVWFQVNIHFHKFMVDVSTSEELEPIMYPSEGANTFPMHDILRMANLDYEHIKDYGAVMSVNKVFECDLDDKVCTARLECSNIDTTTGFNYVHYHYYEVDGKRIRDTYQYYGIRMVTFATGLGKIASFANTVLQVSSAIALLACAQAAADAWLSNVVPERKHYLAQKIIETEDMND